MLASARMAAPFVEYFTQREAAARLAREPAEVRATRRSVARRARQKREAAELLWAASQQAEGLTLLRDSLALYREAAYDAGTGDTLVERLASLGVGASSRARVDRALEGLAGRALPAFDADVHAEDAATFRELSDVAAVLDDAVAEAVLVRSEIATRRVARVGMAVILVVATLTGLVFLVRPTPPAPATASAVFNDDPIFTPEHAIDGDPTTEWLLPDASGGWLDVRVQPPRAVHRVRLTNGHNRDYADRAVRGYRLEAYDGTRLVAHAVGEFPTLVPHPAPITVQLAAPRADRVRVVVTSWFNLGAALSDVRVE